MLGVSIRQLALVTFFAAVYGEEQLSNRCEHEHEHEAVSPIDSERLPRHCGRRNLSLLQVRSRISAVEPELSGWEPWAKDHKLKVVFGVFTSPLPKYAAQMEAVTDTWARSVHPQRLLVVGVNGSVPGIAYMPAPMCKDGHVTNAGISCKEATLLSTGYGLGADWVVVVGSDNYVFTKQMEQRLADEDANKAQILGVFGCGAGDYCEDHKGGLCGGSGYAISRAALTQMVGVERHAGETFVKESMHTARTVCGYWSDQVTSCIARRHGVAEVELSGLYGWRLCADGGYACPFDEAAYREKMSSSDPQALTFHYLQPEEMRRIHAMSSEVSLLAYGNNSAPLTAAASGGQVGLLDHGRSYAAQRAAYIKAVNQIIAPAHRSGVAPQRQAHAD